jgi:hypothetical protein
VSYSKQSGFSPLNSDNSVCLSIKHIGYFLLLVKKFR